MGWTDMAVKNAEVSWIDWPEPFSYAKGELFFEDWEIREELGRGANGSVYRLGKELMGIEQDAAMKVVHIEPDGMMDEMLRSMGQTDASIASRHREDLGGVVREIVTMMALKNHPNVVRCEDFKVYRIGERDSWDIQIKMELLTSLHARMRGGPLPEEEILRVGRDLCQALSACGEYNLIHRDVKPANIFADERGRYKLGDFGTARLQSSGSTMTQKAGSELYMAPEVLSGGHYDHRVDIYSLGIVLYQLANGNRLPFYPEPELITSQAMERAFVRRVGGEALPAPEKASPALARVILRACAFKPEDRFATAEEFHEALLRAEKGEDGAPQPLPAPGPEPAQEQTNAPVSAEAAGLQEPPQGDEEPTGRNRPEAEELCKRGKKYLEEGKYNECFLPIKHASEKGSPEASFLLGQCFENGWGTMHNHEEAMKHILSAARRDCVPAQSWLGGYYTRKDSPEKKPWEGLDWYKKAAEAGYATAQTGLGRCLEYGIGTARDVKGAEAWYRRAAEQGDLAGRLELAQYLIRAHPMLRGAQMNQEIENLVKGAAEAGYAPAQAYLGDMYSLPIAVKRNYPEAAKWYHMAAEQGDPGAEYAMGLKYFSGTGVPKDKAEAGRWLRKAAYHGEARAKAFLAIHPGMKKE